jgi:para-aminobenzoate synthetase component 1
VRSTFSRPAYLDAIEQTRGYIRAGDIFQANISQRLEVPFEGHPFALYETLRRCNPAPFAAYFDIGEAVVVSASPERFLRLERGHVETRPIKGTLPRGSAVDDAAAAHALRASEKDRAENVMIVDLLRNDLSKVCLDHTVAVPQLCVVERHSTVHHLVSTVVGCLRPGLGALDLIRAAFPGGSVTGAPKVRAMEIIAELEPTRRSVYTGALGYIGFDGTMDSSIAIRTFVLTRGTAFFQVGGGIVIDSDPGMEYLETLAKAKGLLTALEAHAGPVDR